MINISDYPEIERVITFFEEISRIPRGSGNTGKIAEYLYNFGRSRGLESYRDAFDNVVIKKPATKGLEDRPAVIIQGHSDMVLAKEPSVTLDLEKEGLLIYRDGDFLKARGTTLGADDGIAVAYALALLDSSDIPHPALECVFTSDEETGLTGAMNIDPAILSGRMMINIDSDDEGVFTVGCAGGARVDITLPIKRKKNYKPAYKLTLSGLLGGHSGVDIDKKRDNAIKVILGLLFALRDIEVSSILGGEADNAIPREACAVFASEKEPDTEELSLLLSEMCPSEAPKITVEPAEAETVIDTSSDAMLFSLLAALPTGVYKMSEDIEGLVETSSNLGICSLSESEFSATVSVRSSIEKEKEELIGIIRERAEELGASVSVRGSYPGWAYKKESALRDAMIECFKKMYKKEPKVVMIHAGLECGLFSDKLDGLDCVSIGPDNFDIHTPKERLSLPSAARVWQFLINLLENI